MINITIDNKSVTAHEGEFVLSAARRAGIEIPSICHHDALEPWGGCRLCLVEQTKASWEGWSRLVTACLYPVEPDIIIYTNTEKVREARRIVLDLLLARCPNTPLVIKYAEEYGIVKSTYLENPKQTNCILCRLCTRICDHLGMEAISSKNRGAFREIAPPFMKPSEACIGCLSCVHICPTNHLTYEQYGEKLKIWGKEFDMLACGECGKYHVTKEEAEYFAKRQKIDKSYFEICDECKRRHHSNLFTSIALVK